MTNNVDFQEAPNFTIIRTTEPSLDDQKVQRIKVALGVGLAVVLLIVTIQFYISLDEQKTDITAMSNDIQQLKQNNIDLKKLIEDQANTSKSISLDLDSTKTKLQSTRQDLDTTQADLLDTKKEIADTRTTVNSVITQFRGIRHEMNSVKQDYSSSLAEFTKKDAAYNSDIMVILEKIQAMDIGSINDKIFELQKAQMVLEKKFANSNKIPFEDVSNAKKLDILP